ncbi:MAG: DUF3696 domain-containing protein [Colwellia sp.]|nr:DUF3696 domain-containing protein [Colwellia sp.]
MINQIKLKNFKCYKERPFKLGSLTVFCGNNSVGKSTVIQALAIPFQSKLRDEISLNGNLVELGSIQEIFSAHAGDSTQLEISIEFSEHNLSWGVDIGSLNHKNQLLQRSEDIDTAPLLQHYFHDFGFQFLQAERFGPRTYLNNNKDDSIRYWLGPKGEYINEVLTTLSDAAEKLSINDKRILNNEEGTTVRRNIINWMSEISPGFSFESEIVTEVPVSYAKFQAYGSNKTNPINMGFGLSYSLGIVCALLITKPGGLVVIENPEAHLHPKGQSYLGRLIAKAALAGVQVIIETHSDHLLNGIRVGARLDPEYQKEMFKIYHVSNDSTEESKAEEITIGNKGELSSWPDGFFDQQSYDLEIIISGEDTSS